MEAIRGRLAAEERTKEYERRTKEYEQKRLAAEERTKEYQQRRLAAEAKIKEYEESRLAAEERLRELEASISPTTLERFLKLVHDCLLPLAFKHKPERLASKTVIPSDGMYYPLELHPWSDFEEKHDQTFSLFTEQLSGKQLFWPETGVHAMRRLISTPFLGHDIERYVDYAIEKPVGQVVGFYLEQTDDTNDTLYLGHKPYGLDGKSDVEAGEDDRIWILPRRWGLRETREDGIHTFLVGEHFEAARTLRDEASTQVLASPPTDLFLRVLGKKQSGADISEEEKTQERVAQVLCQAYHCMIKCGLLYGFVTSGHALVFLRIEESAPWKLLSLHTIGNRGGA